MTDRCAHCGMPKSFPTVDEVWPRRTAWQNKPKASKRVYDALRRSHKVTAEELCKAAWPDLKERNEKKQGTFRMLLKRLNDRLFAHGLAIAKVGFANDESFYRLVGL